MKLQGDAALTNTAMADQRVLTSSNPNYYFVRKQDFNSPNLYNLNILKPYGRSKIRTFLDNQHCRDEHERENYIDKIKRKFLSSKPISSQIRSEQHNKYLNKSQLGPSKYDQKIRTQFKSKDCDEVWEMNNKAKRPKYVQSRNEQRRSKTMFTHQKNFKNQTIDANKEK